MTTTPDQRDTVCLENLSSLHSSSILSKQATQYNSSRDPSSLRQELCLIFFEFNSSHLKSTVWKPFLQRRLRIFTHHSKPLTWMETPHDPSRTGRLHLNVSGRTGRKNFPPLSWIWQIIKLFANIPFLSQSSFTYFFPLGRTILCLCNRFAHIFCTHAPVIKKTNGFWLMVSNAQLHWRAQMSHLGRSSHGKNNGNDIISQSHKKGATDIKQMTSSGEKYSMPL